MNDTNMYPPPISVADVIAYHEHKAQVKAAEAAAAVRTKHQSRAIKARGSERWHQAAAKLLCNQEGGGD